jgi:hypothetical protein
MYGDNDPGGNRRIESSNYWYRYFMRPGGWWVGTNEVCAGWGVGLMRASRLLDDASLAEVAQRELDWILGSNVWNMTMMSGGGENEMVNHRGTMWPAPSGMPTLEGGVMNGIGGDGNDEPNVDNYNRGEYNQIEYWTPMCGMTAWLMAELTRDTSMPAPVRNSRGRNIEKAANDHVREKPIVVFKNNGRLSVSGNGHYAIRLYDLLGRLEAVLFDGELAGVAEINLPNTASNLGVIAIADAERNFFCRLPLPASRKGGRR